MGNELVIQRLKDCMDAQVPCALATVVGITGSIPTEVGSKLLVSAQGQILAGTVGGGALEAVVIHRLVRAIAAAQPAFLEHTLTDDEAGTLGMTCGGVVRLFLEPYVGPQALVLVGAGHVNQALARLARDLDFRVTVIDDRPQWATADYFPHAASLSVVKSLRAPFDEALSLPYANAFLVIATRCHATDRLVVREALKRPFKYIGMIGSRHKIAKVVEELQDEGLWDALAERFYAPIGLDLGGKSPAAVGLSILAEIQMLRHGRSAARSLGAPERAHETVPGTAARGETAAS